MNQTSSLRIRSVSAEASAEFLRIAAATGTVCVPTDGEAEIELSFDGGVRAGTDDYRILSETGGDGRSVLRLSGGNIRGLFYAVYRYFELYCGCRWFWDGDRIPNLEFLPLTGLRYSKRFRLPYRGMRYFAHRSLHRFQAEHWNFDDWRRELDFLLKKQFSMFMLRIGNDDLFQKAFPEFVNYPPHDGPAPEAVERSYNDRTTFRPLEERGLLRKRILDYAFSRGLMHPEDIGPTTHWYSQTPKDFLRHVNPGFLCQSSDNYALDTLHIWDCSDEKNIERYLKLTEAHIQNYGRPDLFHIIGLAERVFGSKADNLRLKLSVFRKFVRKLRERYPSAPLLVASWDFMGCWDAEEVRGFLREANPENTIILDYTTDSGFHNNNFLVWGLPRRFPWIFGIFQAYEPHNDLFFDFSRSDGMLSAVGNDPMCRGMVLWSENSHSNPRLLEYLAKRSADEDFSLELFCRDRYGESAAPMQELWRSTERLFGENAWTFDKERPMHGLFQNHFNLLRTFASLPEDYSSEALVCECRRRLAFPKTPDCFFEKVRSIARTNRDPMIRRDLIDLARTVRMTEISRILSELCLGAESFRRGGGFSCDPDLLPELLRRMERILACDPDYSLNASLAMLRREGPLNSHSEMTLKGNAEDAYCRSYISELYRGIYIPEAEYLASWLKRETSSGNRSLDFRSAGFAEEAARLRDVFYASPLSDFAPVPGSPEEIC